MATTVRVGNELGAGNPLSARRVTYTAFVMTGNGLLFLLSSHSNFCRAEILLWGAHACVCVCVCVCVRTRACVRACVCVCVRVIDAYMHACI